MTVSRKHCVFLSSTGRTGTKFFGDTMSRMIDGCVSVHEPDTTRVSMPRDWIRKMAKFGAPKMLWGQYRERYSLMKLSTTRHRGITGDKKALKYISDNRFDYIEGFRKDLYIESNHIVYGLLDLITEIFPNSKIIWIMRDPRTWIRSAVNAQAYHLYGIWDWDSLNLSIRSYNFDDDPCAGSWKKMNRFEKYCWYYARVNERAFELMEKVPHARIFRFEDLFDRENGEQFFNEMLEYTTSFSDGFSLNYQFKPELLKNKIHAAASKRLLPHWRDWSQGYVDSMMRHCSGIMQRFGYGSEPAWLDKTSRTGPLRYRA